MRIYFCGSIRGGRQDVALYQRIVRKLQELGQVLTEHVSRSDISEKGEDAAALEDKAIHHDRDVQWLHAADVVVAEVTQPSLGVGYELGRAVAMRKRILCLFRPSSGRVLSAMIRGADDGSPNSLVQVRDYVEDEVEMVLDKYFSTPSSCI
ncbi:LOW QUALITY PROTEIN: 5-hydroxymethyl-dUMP N-hydrolase [Scleropages formosus]|uniref:LOW QUALITY PROTEIN: 5-hydroxymethyl-dUMP N-hydrolase n=1 Tax=Scleropages formosus TaxID=113540 RepID=UPI0010FAAE4A|nr:LOW QUALITY PROTEIN: 2'-deoxynucleoside 5'-phosphate N-hydrolase 1 [Scleropages formosus]